MAAQLEAPQVPAPAEADLRTRNRRLALILASTALVFFLGFVVKTVLLSHA